MITVTGRERQGPFWISGQIQKRFTDINRQNPAAIIYCHYIVKSGSAAFNPIHMAVILIDPLFLRGMVPSPLSTARSG
jgi:hypothetical protein